jgi:Ca-activated chloride channel family protein
MIIDYSPQDKIKFPLKVLQYSQKILFVISVYMMFGLLFQHAFADSQGTDSQSTNSQNTTSEQSIDNNPYQSQHGSVWLLPINGLSRNNMPGRSLPANSFSGDGSYIEAIQTQTDVDYVITGAIARATIKQQFTNSSEFWAEGIYVFPLPENAAVDQFRMKIGERIIEGQIQLRQQAKKTYQKARAAGKKTSLIEQQRANVFTTSLANIAPGENITIEFEYQQTLDYKDGYYSLRYPMVVGPRYHPDNTGTKYRQNLATDSSSVYTETDPDKPSNNPTHIHLLLDAGVGLTELKSTYHSVDIIQTSETRYSISTIGESIVANRDFELVWKPELRQQPQLATFTENTDGESYTMLTIMPPEFDYLQQKLQVRDVIFVLDISGSMSGTSIEQAKAALVTAIDSLSSIERFNVIWFNDRAERLFPDAVIASEKYKIYARQLIGNLQARGGTEMLDALKLALANRPPFSRFRQVVFLTDGNISNEVELFTVISQRLADNRLFTIGIGSAPNSYFMRKAAMLGRGTFTYIGDINEVQEKTSQLLKKLETPALINIELDIDPAKYEVFPSTIPDLYAGETTTVLIKGNQEIQNITVTGDYGSTEWRSKGHETSDPAHSDETAYSQTASQKNVIPTAWAREKIASLMSQHHDADNQLEREAIAQDITNTALEHHLVSQYTSLVAVDVTPVNYEGLLLQQRLKNNLPHGWTRSVNTNDLSNGIMLAQTATGSELNLLLSFVFFITAISLAMWQKFKNINAMKSQE